MSFTRSNRAELPLVPVRGLHVLPRPRRGRRGLDLRPLRSAAFDEAVGKMTVIGRHGGAGARPPTRRCRRSSRPPGSGRTTSRASPRTSRSPGWPTTRRPRRCGAEVFGDHQPVVDTVVVDRLVRRPRCSRSSCTPIRGGGELLAAQRAAAAGTWRRSHRARAATTARSTCRRCSRSTPAATSSPRATSSAQYAYCLDRAGELLARGRPVARRRVVHDRTTTRRRRRASVYRQDAPRAQGTARRRRRLPGRRRHPDEPAAPPGRAGRDRRDRLAAPAGAGQPGLVPLRHAHLHARRPGRPDTLYMSGFAALDMETQQAAAPRRPRGAGRGRRTARSCTCCATPASARSDLLATIEYVCLESALRRLPRRGRRARAAAAPAVAGLDRRRSAAACCAPEFLLEVFPTALYPISDA